MKKLGKLFLIGLMLAGCASKQEESTSLKILCPTGAPTLALLSCYENNEVVVTEGTDQLVAELSKTDSVYDIIVAPVNLGANLIAKGKTDYRLDGIVTWGNLYLVGKPNALVESEEILLFGEGAVPSKVYEQCAIASLNPVYVGDASLVSADLASGQASIGMLAEPLASATIEKAKKQNIELQVLMDLQEVYASQTGTSYGYPQAAIFVKEGKDISNFTKELESYTSDMRQAETYLNQIGTDTLGLPASEIVLKSLERQNVRYQKASEVQEQLTSFLKLFNIQFTKEMLNG